MNAHLDTTNLYAATYEVRDQHGQLLEQSVTVQVQAHSKMEAMLAAVDKVLTDVAGAANATCRGCRKI